MIGFDAVVIDHEIRSLRQIVVCSVLNIERSDRKSLLPQLLVRFHAIEGT